MEIDNEKTFEPMKSCFPYAGGKSSVIDIVWPRFGDTIGYVEPFFGSGAMLLGRPFPVRTETVNDANVYIANFFRAVKADPEQVAYYADNAVNHADLIARHRWLKGIPPQSLNIPEEYNTPELQAAYVAGYQAHARPPLDIIEFIHRIKQEESYYDVKAAGYWVWGQSCWMGSGWCELNDRAKNSIPRPSAMLGQGTVSISNKIPELMGMRGVHRAYEQRPNLRPFQGVNGVSAKRPHLKSSDGINSKRPNLQMTGGKGVVADSMPLYDYMLQLSERLRRVRVVCGDWTQITGASVTYKMGMCSVFLDPPYQADVRHAGLYAVDDKKGEKPTSTAVREWCLEYIVDKNNNTGQVYHEGPRYLHPKMRLALCGYSDEHDKYMPDDWERVEWESSGGMSNQKVGGRSDNYKKEVIYFSPHCLKPEQYKQTSWL